LKYFGEFHARTEDVRVCRSSLLGNVSPLEMREHESIIQQRGTTKSIDGTGHRQRMGFKGCAIGATERGRMWSRVRRERMRERICKWGSEMLMFRNLAHTGVRSFRFWVTTAWPCGPSESKVPPRDEDARPAPLRDDRVHSFPPELTLR